MIRRIKFLGRVLFVIAFCAVGAAQAAEGDPVAGKDKSALCQGCHGEDGISVNPMCPNLAGQFPKYIEKQIRDFQSERRTDPIMTGMAQGIEEKQDAKDIAAYFASRKRMKGSAGSTNKELAAKGEVIFHGGNPDTGLYACSNCHGENGKGKSENNNLFPVIGGQTRDYIMKQLKDLRSGDRHNDPAGMMGNIAKKMSDAEIEAVAEYATGL
ncbi:MAG: cytochrome c4 [Nitrosomonadales bacterium]|nr:cytochrome c4 [Nitrosomonadales bacterium]